MVYLPDEEKWMMTDTKIFYCPNGNANIYGTSNNSNKQNSISSICLKCGNEEPQCIKSSDTYDSTFSFIGDNTKSFYYSNVPVTGNFNKFVSITDKSDISTPKKTCGNGVHGFYIEKYRNPNSKTDKYIGDESLAEFYPICDSKDINNPELLNLIKKDYAYSQNIDSPSMKPPIMESNPTTNDSSQNNTTETIQENIKTTIDNLSNLSLIPVVDNLKKKDAFSYNNIAMYMILFIVIALSMFIYSSLYTNIANSNPSISYQNSNSISYQKF
jgi:hypothetical protein